MATAGERRSTAERPGLGRDGGEIESRSGKAGKGLTGIWWCLKGVAQGNGDGQGGSADGWKEIHPIILGNSFDRVLHLVARKRVGIRRRASRFESSVLSTTKQ